MNDYLLIINQLRKVYKKNVIALDGLDFSLKHGQIVGFVGPNGAGKSTTINILANVLKRDSGDIIIFGEKLTNKSYKYKSNTGFVLEFPVYIEKLSIKEYLSFAGYMYGMNDSLIEKRSKELIAFFEMTNKQDEWIENYSTGMKKKVSLCATLIHDPEFLVLDEPFEGMDPIAIKKTKQLFRDLKKQGKTILITSHILGYLENLCDEVAIINKGKLVYQNTMDNVKSEFKNKIGERESLSALEEIFLDVVGEDADSKQTLSWVNKNEKS